MKPIMPFLLTDSYKISHAVMVDDKTEYTYCTMTPRASRIDSVNKVVLFGLQGFIKEYLIDYFNDNFFNKPKEEVIGEYKRVITAHLGEQAASTKHIEFLHDLGYLPIAIHAFEEGSLVDIRNPYLTIENTIPEAFWLPTFLETLMSSEIWKTITAATISKKYYDICTNYADKTCDTRNMVQWQCHNFSFRGMSGLEDATKCGAAHSLFFTGSDTIPNMVYLENYYGADCTKELISASVLATEHSIQCQYQDDKRYYEYLLNKFSDGILSVVSDGYDYWNVITNIIPSLKDAIMSRNGKLVVRGDSGDPVDIICGTSCNVETIVSEDDLRDFFYDVDEEKVIRFIYDGVCYILNSSYTIKEFIRDYGADDRFEWKDLSECVYKYGYLEVDKKYDPNSPIVKGSIELLWETFGGTINSKGHKVLDPHIGYIYGDAITIERAEQIFSRLEAKGFASENVVFGVGSFSFQYVTRDTFSQALKAVDTIVDGKEIAIFKNPKTDDGTKKSARGRVAVINQGDKQVLIDGLTKETLAQYDEVNLLKPVFKDGQMLRFTTLSEIRNKLS